MAENSNILENSDQQLFELITEALRAGPGTPQWQAALNALPQSAADEYTQLAQIRESLASGKSYREIHAGPGFTRNVMASVERESLRRDRPSITTWIIIISAAVILVILGTIGYFALPKGATPAGNLNELVFSEVQLSTNFDHGMPAGWNTPVSLREPLAFEVVLRPSANETLQAYVADKGQPAEIDCVVRDNQATVVLSDGRTAGESVKLQPSEPATIRMVMNRETALIEVSGKRLWSGPHHLNPNNPCQVGVSFLNPTSAPSKNDSVQSVRIVRSAKQ